MFPQDPAQLKRQKVEKKQEEAEEKE